MAANPHEATARTLKALELERVLVEAGATAALVDLLGPDARELAEREVHKRRQAPRLPSKRRDFGPQDKGSAATWATVVTLMRQHEQVARDADDRVSLGS